MPVSPTNNKEKYFDRSVLVFYHCVTNHHKHRGLKQYPLIISQFFGSKYCVVSTVYSAQDLTSLKSRCCVDRALIWTLWRSIHSK